MAIIINPSDTLQAPSLVLSSENQFGNVIASNVGKIIKSENSIKSPTIQTIGHKASITGETTTDLYNVKSAGSTTNDWIRTCLNTVGTSDFTFPTSLLSSSNTEISCVFGTLVSSGIQTDSTSGIQYREYSRLVTFDIKISEATNTANIKSIGAFVMFSDSAKARYSTSNMIHTSISQSLASDAIYSHFGASSKRDFVYSLLKKIGSWRKYKRTKVSDYEIIITFDIIFAYQIKYNPPYNTFIIYNDYPYALIKYNLLESANDTSNFSYGSSDSAYSLDLGSNPFIFQSTKFSGNVLTQYNAEQVISRYENGKHYGTITIKVGKYYDSSDSSTVVYDPSFSSKKYISVGETVCPYVYDTSKELIPLLSKNSAPVNFIVMDSKLVFNNGILSVEMSIMES